jgi:hypothetical protein
MLAFELRTERLGDRVRCGLRRRVAAEHREAPERHERQHVHDRRTAARALEHGQEALDDRERAEDVGAEIGLHRGLGRREDVRRRGDARVVHQKRDVSSRPGGRRDLLGLRRVERERDDPRVVK